MRYFLRARFDCGDSVSFIAWDGTVPMGFAQLYPSFSSVSLARVFIRNDLFVHEAGRRKGVASSLLAAAENHALAMGAVRVTLNVASDNEAGRALYKAQRWALDSQFLVFHRVPDRP